MNILKIKKLDKKAIVPKYATPGAGAFDLHAINVQTKEGDRIAQAIIVKADQWAFEVTEELSETERGEGGFGHTGAA